MLARACSYLLRWSATMGGVYFVVVSDREARAVRHVRIERAEGGGVAAMVPAEGGMTGSAC